MRTTLAFSLSALAFSLSAAFASSSAIAADAAKPRAEASPRSELVLRALSLLGVNYKFGGNSPDTGLDCSGLVRHVFAEAMGLMLPRRSEEISREGDAIGREQLKPGDLVFFNTLRRTFSHVGIYIGNNQFVHAPSSGGAVRVENMTGSYWTKRFNGARRVLALDGSHPESPALQSRPAEAATAIGGAASLAEAFGASPAYGAGAATHPSHGFRPVPSGGVEIRSGSNPYLF